VTAKSPVAEYLSYVVALGGIVWGDIRLEGYDRHTPGNERFRMNFYDFQRGQPCSTLPRQELATCR
jgi:hypothetical protein